MKITTNDEDLDERIKIAAVRAGASASAYATDVLREHFDAATEGFQIRFDGPPGPESGRFVECESLDGRGVSVGTWVQDGDDWLLKINVRPGVKLIEVEKLP